MILRSFLSLRLWVAATCMIVLAGCFASEPIRRLSKMPKAPSPFHQALADAYLAFAEEEAGQYDWWSADHFARKGLKASQGEIMAPEMLDDWDIPDHTRDELLAARMQLEEALKDGLAERDPSRAAEMLFIFDRWVEEQEEAWQLDVIVRCRERFYVLVGGKRAFGAAPVNALKQMPIALDSGLKPANLAVVKAPAKPLAKPVKIQAAPALPAPKAIPPRKITSLAGRTYVLNFPWDSYEAEGRVRDELETIASSMRQYRKQQLLIHGHSDAVGSTDYNLELSKKRAEFIRKELLKMGVSPAQIQYYAFGDSDPEVPSQPGVPQKANSRVEIFIE